MNKLMIFAAFSLAVSGYAGANNDYAAVENLASLEVSFTDAAWGGESLPDGQHCKMFEGNGTSPELSVNNIPAGTNAIIVAFNDKSYAPNDNGGHGTIGIWVDGGQSSVTVPSVAAETTELPEGMFVEAVHRSDRGEAGAYLPPCSGGRGNLYSATVKAVYKDDSDSEGSRLLGEAEINLGRY